MATLVGRPIVPNRAVFAQRTGSKQYNDNIVLPQIQEATINTRLTSTTLVANGTVVDAVTRLLGGSISLTIASTDLAIIGALMGLTPSTTGTPGSQVQRLAYAARNLPFVGITIGYDTNEGVLNGVHVFMPKAVPTADTFQILTGSGDENITFPTTTLELVCFPDTAYTTGQANEVQELTIDATGGTFTISLGSEETGDIAFDADATAIQTAIEGLAQIGTGNVAVTGSGPFTITFQGDRANLAFPLLTTDATSLTGGGTSAVIARDTKGAAGDLPFMYQYENEEGLDPTVPTAFATA